MDESTAHSAVLEEFTLRGFDTSAIASACAPAGLALPDMPAIEKESLLIVDILEDFLESEGQAESEEKQAHNMKQISELLIPTRSRELRRSEISRVVGKYGAVEKLLQISTSNPRGSINNWAFSCLTGKHTPLEILSYT